MGLSLCYLTNKLKEFGSVFSLSFFVIMFLSFSFFICVGRIWQGGRQIFLPL